MKARGKLVSLLMALVCLLPIGMGLLGFGDSASAATPQNVKVTLHKKKMDDFPKGLENDGAINQEIEDKYEGLPGVTFRPWDITELFYQRLAAEGITGSESETDYKVKVDKVMKDFTVDNIPVSDKKPVAGADAKVTGPDGTVDFTLPDRDAEGVYRVYWFEETLPADAEEFSQLVILALPVMKVGSTTEQSGDIHLYPKNKLPNKPEKDLLDENGDEEDPTKGPYSYDVGKQIKYRVKYQIPQHIGDTIGEGATLQTRYSKLTFKDEVSHAGVRFVGFDSIKALGKTPAQDINLKDDIDTNSATVATQKFNYDTGYTATGKAGFEIAFKLDDKQGTASSNSRIVAEWLKTYAGKTLEIVYTVQFTKDTPVDQEIGNSFYVDLQQNDQPTAETQVPEVVPPKVITGGKKFIKHEAGERSQVLKGAEFVITNKDGSKYLAGTADNYTWENYVDDTYPNAIKITSSDDGSFEITGLKFGEYQLVETKAPNGYAKSGPIDFVVEKDQYNVEVGLRQGIPNVSRGGFLPSTGGIGIAIFLIIGGSLMGFAVSRYRKQQHAA